MIVLQEATTENICEVWEMQIKAFEDLLQKYQDYESSIIRPARLNILKMAWI